MTTPSSNMTSKQYCPYCGGFNLVKLHRSFIQKRILNSPNKLSCQSCERVLSITDFQQNVAKDVPVFIEQVPQKATTESPTSPFDQPVSIENPNEDNLETSNDIEDIFGDLQQQSKPPKRRSLLTGLLYIVGLAAVAAAAYVGYNQFIAKEVDTTPNEEPTLKAPTATPSASIKEESPEPEVTTPLPPPTNLKTRKIAAPHTPEQDTHIQSEQSMAPIPQPIKIPPQSQAIDVPELATDIVMSEIPRDQRSIPALETEIRIVLPLKESHYLKSRVNNPPAIKIPEPSISTPEIKTTEAGDPLLEKAAIEFMKTDLDKLFEN